MKSKARYEGPLVALAGFLITVRMFYPGIMTNDSIDQYSQALSLSFSDWHPPMMAFIWALIDRWLPGPLGMLMLNSALYWGGLYLLSESLRERSRLAALVMLMTGYLPFLIGTLGYIWKDTLHATLWVFAMSLLAWGGRRTRRPRLILGFVAILLLIGSMVRVNAIVGLPPLIWLWLRMSGRKSISGLASGTVAGLVLCILASGFFGYGLLHARKTGSYNSLLVFDVGGISHFARDDLFKENWEEDKSRMVVSECYSPVSWDGYMWGKCAFVGQGVKASGEWDSGHFLRKWLTAVVTYPGAYLRHRTFHFLTFLQHPQAVLVHVIDKDKNPWGFDFQRNGMFKLLDAATQATQQLFIYKPWFWLTASLVIAFLAARAQPNLERDFVLALALSAFLYTAGYFVVGVASDFRYIYWSMLGTSIAAIFLVAMYLKRYAPPQISADESAPTDRQARP